VHDSSVRAKIIRLRRLTILDTELLCSVSLTKSSAPPLEACLSNVTLAAKQRRNFLRFLNRHWLKRFLVVDNLHRGGRPALRTGAGPIPVRPAVAADSCSLFADQLSQVTA
jgi:hypothetical protein